MKCRNCKREIEDNSIFCNWCGLRQIKEAKREIKIPKPRQRHGKWNIELRAEGQSITADTEEECRARAIAIRAGFLETKAKAKGTLRAACDRYIADRTAILSPATIRGYRVIQKNRFQSVMDVPISSVGNWQKVVNDEAKKCAPKTVKNAWGFIRKVLESEGVYVKINTPKVPKAKRNWLTPEQIREFVELVRGRPCEIPALLALHSLRRSEIAALTWENVNLQEGYLVVSGSIVPDENQHYVRKDLNKTQASTRAIKILIPALKNALEALESRTGPVYTGHINTPYKQINALCAAHGLPEVGIHGLRHSFASLGYHLRMSEMEVMQLGGWSDLQTVHKIYTHLSELDRAKAENKMSEFYRNSPEFTTETEKA